jgi:hypothetical protein
MEDDLPQEGIINTLQMSTAPGTIDQQNHFATGAGDGDVDEAQAGIAFEQLAQARAASAVNHVKDDDIGLAALKLMDGAGFYSGIVEVDFFLHVVELLADLFDLGAIGGNDGNVDGCVRGVGLGKERVEQAHGKGGGVFILPTAAGLGALGQSSGITDINQHHTFAG